MPSQILPVDDDPVVCELIQEVSGSPEIESFSHTNSSQAVTHFSRKKHSARFSSMGACRRRTASN
jgi:hypothetical protein